MAATDGASIAPSHAFSLSSPRASVSVTEDKSEAIDRQPAKLRDSETDGFQEKHIRAT